MRWKTTHNWQRKENSVNDRGEFGYFIECNGCNHRIFIPNKWNDFQRELEITFYFGQIVSDFRLPQKTIESFSVPSEYNMNKGIHGIMSEDCKAAVEWPRLASVLEVMEM
jgi:hypothetical protein